MRIIQFWVRSITYIGINSTMNYVKKKRNLMVNLIAIISIPFMTCFLIANLLEERYGLATINFCNTLSSALTLVLQYYKKHKAAKTILLVSYYFCFFIGALIFQNAGQYYLLSTLIIAMLLFDNNRIHVLAAFIIIPSIIIIEISAPIYTITNPLPHSRVFFNIIRSISFIIIAIHFYIQILYNKMKKIENQRLKLQIANQDKEKIFSIIAHDIKSPFSTLENLASALHEQILNNEASKEFIEQICRQIKAQNKTLDDLLKWGSSNIKGVRKTPSILSIKSLIEKILTTSKENIHTKRLTVNILLGKNDQIYADKDHIVIILRNLISNAIKFSYTNGIINISSTFDNEKTYIHIQDYGIGINNIKRSVLFNEIQNRSLGTSNEPGSGLGLLLCRDLIEQNDGTITIESKPQKGSIFTIGLPTKEKNIGEENSKTIVEQTYLYEN